MKKIILCSVLLLGISSFLKGKTTLNPLIGNGTFNGLKGVKNVNNYTYQCNNRFTNFTVQISATNDTCSKYNNGTATANVSGGTPPYTYLWSPGGQTTSTITGLSAGTYNVSITDAASNNLAVNATVALESFPVGTNHKVNATCYGLCNGSVNVSASGGVKPYAYAWSPSGGNDSTGTGLCAGTYTCTVTDSIRCNSSYPNIIIIQPQLLTATMGPPTNDLCDIGNDGSAIVTANGGTSPYTYSWTPSGQTNAKATGLTAGTYTVTVTDAHGCDTIVTVTITQPTSLTITMAQTNVLCNGGSNGSVSVTVSGGTPAYTYSWTPGGQTNATITGLAIGTYTVKVTDNSGCIGTAFTTITQPPILTATMGAPANILCKGGNNGSASVTAGGGTPVYTYSWSPAGGIGSTGTGLTAGTYTVTVTDHNSCTASSSVTITQPPTAVNATMGAPTNVLCYSSNDGSASVTAGGGTPVYTYSWSPAGGIGSTGTGLTAGTYTVTVTDHNSCTAISSVTITQPAALVANSSVMANVSCNGGNNGSAQSVPTGGTSPYTYSWQGGATATSISNLTKGTYTLTVTDNHGCTATGSVTITQPAASLAANTSVTANVSCNGDNNGNAQSAPSGGTNPYTYSWQGGATTASISNLTTGTYTLMVTDNYGCTATGSVTITQPAASLAANASVTANVSCNGGNNGSAQTIPTGGTSPYSYSWQGGGTTTSISNLTTGTYTLTVTDNHGCTATGSVTITQPAAAPAISIATQTNVICNGGTGSATANAATGGTIPYTYSWSSGGGTSLASNAITSGTYIITVTDAHSCTATASATITQPAALAANASVTANVSCNGGNNDNAQSVPTGGTSPYTYSWQGGATATSISNLTIGTYTLMVTDNYGCTATGSVTITQPAASLAANASVTANVSCNGGNNGSAQTIPTGGTSPYSYSWQGGGTTTSISNLTTGTYTLTVTDNHGCTATGSVTITQPGAALAISIATQTNVICNGGTGSATANAATGGTLPYTYSWSSGGGTSLASNAITSGTYTITVTDAHSCSATASATITQPAALAANASVTANVSCNGGNNDNAQSVPTGGTSPYTYSWQGGATATSISNLTIGTYTLTVTDNHGCTAFGSVTITQPSASLVANTSVTANVSCNGGNNGSATVTASGGTSPYTYSWTPSGQTNAKATGLTAGTYTVTVTDAHGCDTIVTVTITQPTSLTITMAQTNVLCNGVLSAKDFFYIFASLKPNTINN